MTLKIDGFGYYNQQGGLLLPAFHNNDFRSYESLPELLSRKSPKITFGAEDKLTAAQELGMALDDKVENEEVDKGKKKISKPRPPRVTVQADGSVKYKGVTYPSFEEFQKKYPNAKIRKVKTAFQNSGNFPSINAEEYGKFLNEQNKPKITVKPETTEVPKNIYPHKDAATYEKMLNAAKSAEKAKGASKFAKFGKWGAAIAAGALLIGGAYALLSGKDEAPAKPAKAQTPEKPAVKPPKKEGNPHANSTEETSGDEATAEQSVVVTPAPNTEEVTPETLEPGKTLITSDGKIYKVNDRDNVWNIAKKYLKEKNKDVQGYEPSAQEIKAEEQRIMQLNNLSFDNSRDKKNYYCVIRPNDIIKLENAA